MGRGERATATDPISVIRRLLVSLVRTHSRNRAASSLLRHLDHLELRIRQTRITAVFCRLLER